MRWNAFDVETGESRLISRRELRQMARSVQRWQDDLERQAHESNLDVLRVDVDQEKALPALLEFCDRPKAEKTMKTLLLHACAGWSASSHTAAPPPRPREPPQEVAVAPIECWWKTDRSAVRVGERFDLTLTCAVLDTDKVKVVVDESSLSPAALHLVPFDIIGGHRFATSTTARGVFSSTSIRFASWARIFSGERSCFRAFRSRIAFRTP